MATLSELMAQKDALEQKIAEARRNERAEAIQRIKALMDQYGLGVGDLSGKPSPRKGAKVPVKYRDPASGQSWSGRGLQPKWLQAALASGRRLSDFAVK